jgi:hypothetical protein
MPVFDPPLPYRLNRPAFTFFRRFSIAGPPLAASLGLLGDTALLLTALTMGIIFWVIFGVCLLMARHSITIYDDGLLFEISGVRYSAFYKDLRWVDVERTASSRSIYDRLWVAWEGLGDKPLLVNFEIFGQKDRKLLLRTIATRAPHTALNDLAREFATRN